eukprot:TRINITY_DN74335_c0_g1_i1.p1 TRINITY_DN74335_c0_g1~~TRINITY_DN74335_c0_g1_i1.p1  ORF type:complete len:460 (-),score=75.62 TRINITY_DN74335_c0_g1_i1:96-1400(-)
MAQRVGILQTKKPITVEEHRAWSLKLWHRLDRDHSGLIEKTELLCDEVQDVLKSILVPKLAGKTIATYGRSEQNFLQVVNYIMRMADTDNSGELDYEEFDRFMRVLRTQSGNPDLIFSMFDLDNDNTIEKEEFLGIFRFFLGRTPTEAEMNEQWRKLNPSNKEIVSRREFIQFFMKTKNPVFKQKCPPVIGAEHDDLLERSDIGAGASQMNRKKHGEIFRPAPGLLPRKYSEPAFQPSWNFRFASKDPSEQNLAWRGNQRAKTWFGQYESLPDLKQFYNTHIGFGQHRRAFRKEDDKDVKWIPSVPTDEATGLGSRRRPRWKTGPGGEGPPVPRTIPTLSEDTVLDLKAPGAWRHVQLGTMGEHPWRELTPRAHKVVKEPKASGALLLRCPGLPPKWLAVGRSDSAEACLLTYEGSSSAARLREGPLAGLHIQD